MNAGLPSKILYVEDNPVDVDLVRRALLRQAPELTLDVASTIADARRMLDQPDAGYSLLLSDLNLPDGSGLEVLTHVRERQLPIAVVLLTGSGDQAAAVAALKAGADDYVVKRADYRDRLLPTLTAAQARFRAEQAGKRRQLRVLYAEHNSFDIDLTRRHFSRHAPQITLHVVHNGNEALDAFPLFAARGVKAPFDVVLLDYQLPGVNALEVAKVLRDERGFDVPVVLASGQGSEDVVAEALRLGVADYLLKHAGYLVELPAVLEHAYRRAELMREQARLRETSERQRLQAAALDSSRDAVLITDLDARILSVNPAFTRIMGYTEAEVKGRYVSMLQSARHDRAFYQGLGTALKIHGQWQGEIWNRRKNGETSPQWMTVTTVRNANGQPTHYVAVLTDLTLLKRAEEQREYIANFDPLTDLPNRALVHSLLQHALEKARSQNEAVGVLFINLDKFKTINDSLGHALGDRLLIDVAHRLRDRLGASYSIGRMSADEFVVLLDHMHDQADAEAAAFEILFALEAPFVLRGEEVYIRASIGISLFPQDADNAQDLLNHADAAVHRAKEHGGNQVAFYTSELSVRALTRLQTEAGLRRALDKQEFLLYFQPKVDLSTGDVIGAEALLRWQRPERGLVPPAEFTPLAEKDGQIVPIGAWTINEACRQLRAWQDAGLRELTVAVNVSARQFRSEDLESVIIEALTTYQVPASRLMLELTESMLIEDPERTIERLHGLKRIGVQLSLDDFGTGYSSLSYLSRFPMDQLKIDRSFVTDIDTNPDSANIANCVIDLAHRMRLKVVAEGVETSEQLAYLRNIRCDEIQGFYFSKPLQADDFAQLVREERRLVLN